MDERTDEHTEHERDAPVRNHIGAITDGHRALIEQLRGCVGEQTYRASQHQVERDEHDYTDARDVRLQLVFGQHCREGERQADDAMEDHQQPSAGLAAQPAGRFVAERRVDLPPRDELDPVELLAGLILHVRLPS